MVLLVVVLVVCSGFWLLLRLEEVFSMREVAVEI
jgi:hypothetical protein